MDVSDQVTWESLLAEFDGKKEMIIKAVEHYKKTVLSVKKTGTVYELCCEYEQYCESQSRKPVTLSTIRQHCRKFTAAFGGPETGGAGFGQDLRATFLPVGLPLTIFSPFNVTESTAGGKARLSV
jgi:hypothetical protein